MDERSFSSCGRGNGFRRYAMVEAWHPAIMLAYLAVVVVISCAAPSSMLLAVGCLAGSALLLQTEGLRALRTVGAAAALGAAVMVLAPFFDTSGTLVLFACFGRPYTLEALLRGLVTGLLVVAMLVWFACLFRIVSADGILRTCGRLAPRIGMVSSLVMQMMPRLVRRASRVRSARAGAGLTSVDDCFAAKAHEVGAVFATVASDSLERSVVSADCMESRGYGTGKRTCAALEPFASDERLFLGLAGALLVIFCVTVLLHRLIASEAASIAAVTSFGLYAFLPVLFNASEDVRWRI